MGNELARRVRENTTIEKTDREAGAPTLAQRIMQMQDEFARAMPRGGEAVQLVRDAITCLRTTPKLAECQPASVLGGLMTCAQLGLRPGVLGHAWLLPFWDARLVWLDDKGRERTGGHRAQLVIGYQGYRELAQRSGQIATVIGREVRANDHFELDYGIADNLVHKPKLDGPRGDTIGYYAIVKYTSGGYAFWYMSRDDVEEHRDRFAMARKPIYRDGKKTGETEIVGPWRDNFDEMAIKGLAVDTPIPTPSGWSTMGALLVGEQVIDMHGQPCRVVVKSEVKRLDCYRVTFGDGESIVCDAEHIWVARIGSNDGRDAYRSPSVRSWKTYGIGELFAAKEAGWSVTVPVAGPINLPDAELPVDPWVLGYWLGDGAKGAPRVTCNVDNHAEVITAITSAGYQVGSVRRDPRSRAVDVYIKGLGKHLAAVGVLGHKHVPAEYLRASTRQRLALLRGLMDSDGGVDSRRHRAYFANTNPILANAVAELARSLGEIVHMSNVTTRGYGTTAESVRVSWLPSISPVTLASKRERIRERQLAPYRTVKSIEKIASVPTQCIGVDAPTNTYLAGESMVPTHNTAFLRLAKWMPKSTELASAIEADGSVRVDLTPDPDALLHGERPSVIEGEPAEPEPQTVDAEAVPDDEDSPEQSVSAALAKEIVTKLGSCGVTEKDTVLATISEMVGRPVTATKQLTRTEGTRLAGTLDACIEDADGPEASLAAHLVDLQRAAEEAKP